VIFESHGATMAASHFSRVTAQSCDLECAFGPAGRRRQQIVAKME
jgi:hypothetical protein